MKKKPPDKRRSSLSQEDQSLWEHLAASLKPMNRTFARVHPAAPGAHGELQPRPAARTTQHHAIASAEGRLDITKVEPPAHIEPSKAPDLNIFDRKAARRLRQGRFEIEARIDLHGMRQVEAHAALRRFLFSCHSRGLRWVLVITGKGSGQRRRDDDSISFGYTEERGVLKRNVPMWLAEPELRAVVVSYTTAAIQHGGEGALYVQLRNAEKLRR